MDFINILWQTLQDSVAFSLMGEFEYLFQHFIDCLVILRIDFLLKPEKNWQ